MLIIVQHSSGEIKSTCLSLDCSDRPKSERVRSTQKGTLALCVSSPYLWTNSPFDVTPQLLTRVGLQRRRRSDLYRRDKDSQIRSRGLRRSHSARRQVLVPVPGVRDPTLPLMVGCRLWSSPLSLPPLPLLLPHGQSAPFNPSHNPLR